jgi:type I restriction enzyme S subunit
MIIERKSIPKDWDLISVEDCFDILDNQRKPLNESERNLMRGDIPYYGANGVVDYVNEFLFDDDLILIAEDGGYFDEFQTRPIAYKVKGKAWINNHAHVLKAKNGYYQDYLFYCLEHKNILIWLNGGTRAKLNKGDLEKLPIQIAPHPEQKAIAKVLSTADAAIHTTEKIIAQKELRNKWLMQQLLTGKKRLKGFSGEWKEVRISDCLSRMANGITYDTEKRTGIPVTRIETISDGVINFNKIGFADSADNIEDYRLQKGDILYSHINSLAHIGKVAIYYDEEPLYHGMNLLLLRCNEQVNSIFFYQWLVSENGRKKATSLAKPAVNQASISTTELRKVTISIPSIEEQTAIAHVLQAADKEISLLKAKAEKLREQKKGLMQQLLTGKVRLKIK